jgi:hypothetical protein
MEFCYSSAYLVSQINLIPTALDELRAQSHCGERSTDLLYRSLSVVSHTTSRTELQVICVPKERIEIHSYINVVRQHAIFETWLRRENVEL